MDKNNLKVLLAEKARLQANKSELTTNALEAIKDKTGSIDSELEAVNGFISTIVNDGAAKQRKALSKDTGAVNFVNYGIQVTHTVPKSVKWDQKQLISIAARIAGAGENIGDYMTAEYKVEEKKFKAWIPSIRMVFQPARTVKPGNATIKFKEVN